MTAARGTAIAAAIVLVMATLPAAALAGQGQPAAGEIGITDDTIRIAVIADVDNPALPGFAQGSVDGVEAGVEFINRRGGLAGRRTR